MNGGGYGGGSRGGYSGSHSSRRDYGAPGGSGFGGPALHIQPNQQIFVKNVNHLLDTG